MVELWRQAVGYEGLYEVSSIGRIRSISKKGSKGGILASRVEDNGYVKVCLYREGRRKSFWVHRLVLEAFVGPCPEGQEGCHGDGNRSHNSLENLRWDTKPANYQDTVKHGTAATGERNGSSKLRASDIPKIIEMRKCGSLQREIAASFNLSQQQVSTILSGEYHP